MITINNVGYINEYPIQDLNPEQLGLQKLQKNQYSRNDTTGSFNEPVMELKRNDITMVETKKSTSKTI